MSRQTRASRIKQAVLAICTISVRARRMRPAFLERPDIILYRRHAVLTHTHTNRCGTGRRVSAVRNRAHDMKVVIADELQASAIELLRAEGWTVHAHAGRSRSKLVADLGDADALIVRSTTTVSADLIAAAPHLRVIARAGTGVDNIDLDAASARGILVLNAPGVNSVSVAEHACAFLLTSARSIALADAQMKAGRWEKHEFQGAELRGKTLGVVGLGRIGREVVRRVRAFDMEIIAHDPFISTQISVDLGVELVTIDRLCARSDFITLHVPSTESTRGLFNRARLERCKCGVRIINTARGDLIDEDALADAITSGHVGGAALDVFQKEPPSTTQLTGLSQVVATPHIAASTREAQEFVALETATCVREFLRAGMVRNAVNFPSVAPDEFKRLQPYVTLAERLGSLLAQLTDGRTEAVGIRYYGALAESNNEILVGATLVGLFRHVLSSAVTLVNARSVAKQRGVEIIESRSSRPRNFTSLISLKLHTSDGELWIEGAVFEPDSARLVLLDGVEVEAPLEGTLIVIRNNDQPGVIGEVGSILGRHGINIATFALGRSAGGAVGVVSVESDASPTASGPPPISTAVLDEIRSVRAVRRAGLVRL